MSSSPACPGDSIRRFFMRSILTGAQTRDFAAERIAAGARVLATHDDPFDHGIH